MSLKLNLGAGTFPLPYERGNVPHANYLEPLPEECYEPGWVNIDKFPHAGIEETINLFTFPWIKSTTHLPFTTDSIDFIYASHFVEHIPHEVKVADHIPLGWKEYRNFVENYDGFFVFFAEVWRILKPDGLIHVRCPYATTYDALCDPTHTRFITPGTFGYLTDVEEDAPFNYKNHSRFQIIGNMGWRMPMEWHDKAKNYTSEGFQDLMRNNYNVVSEIRITLRAVK
jgi:predicted SAM-dependent methyltransferase